MKELDFERAAMLMDVINKVVNTSPQNQALLGEAQAELKAINDDAYANQQERAEERRQAELQRQEAEGLKLREDHQQPRVEDVVEDDDEVIDPGVDTDGDNVPDTGAVPRIQRRP